MELQDRMLTHKLNIEDEPLLQPSKNKYVLFPVEYEDIWKVYKDARAVDWNAEEINLSEDMQDWGKKLKQITSRTRSSKQRSSECTWE